MIVSDEGIKLGYTGGKVIGNILVNVDGITLRFDVVKKLISLYGSFDYSNDDNLDSIILRDTLGSTDGKFLAVLKSSEWDLLMIKCLAIYLEI